MQNIHEIILQTYVKDNFREFDDEFFQLFQSNIDSVRFNSPKDKFPDLFFTLKNGKEIPVEVEWKTSNFDHESNPIFPWFKENHGMVMVGVKESDVNLGLKEIKVDLDKFEKWYIQNAPKLVSEELKELESVEKATKRRQPKVWFTLLTKKGGALAHFEPALEYQTWGIQEKYNVGIGKGTRLQEIQANDLIVFLAGLHGNYKNKHGKNVAGRYNMKEWSKKSFNGKFDYALVFKISSDYYYSKTPKIWKTSQNGKWKDEVFPHRFKFNKNPVMILKDLRVKNLSTSTKSELQNTVYVNFRMGSNDTLADLIHYGVQVNGEQFSDVLNLIPKLQ